MKASFITIKTSKQALQWLRLVSAYTGEPQYAVLERLLQHELRAVQEQHGAERKEAPHGCQSSTPRPT